jgi:FixJ family two-component response regulator
MRMSRPVVYVLDDEADIVDLVEVFLKDQDVEVRKFTRPEDFLTDFDGTPEGCLIMDIQMPGLNGVQVLERIRGWLPVFPVVFISAHANVPITVTVMQHGAFDLIQKPFDREEIVKRTRRALEWSKDIRVKFKDSAETWSGMQSLTQREREIMDLLLAGMSSREIAAKLDISRFTVDHHRAHIMDKLKSPSLSGLTSAVARAKTIFESGSSIVRLGETP